MLLYSYTVYSYTLYSENVYKVVINMNLNKFLPLTETMYYILLSLLNPLHGYGIMQRVEQLSDSHVKIAAGTLYGALENLVKQKLIEIIKTEGDDRRKVYKLTTLGLEILTMEYERMKKLTSLSKDLLEVLNNENV